MEVADIFMRMLASICVSYDQDPLHSEEAVNLLISSIVGKLQEIFNKPFHTNNLHILRALVKFLFVLFRETEQ